MSDPSLLLKTFYAVGVVDRYLERRINYIRDMLETYRSQSSLIKDRVRFSYFHTSLQDR